MFEPRCVRPDKNDGKRWQLCEFTLYTPFVNILWSERWSTYSGALAQMFGKFNWYNFTPIHIEFEYETYGPLFHMTLQVLGFGWYISVNAPWETDNSRMLEERVKDFKERNKDEGSPPYDLW